jgi:predicted site-specific integrase-resolvase
MKELISQEQAARVLGVSIDTIDNYYRRGLLRQYKTPGGRNRYELQQVESLAQPTGPKTARKTKQMSNNGIITIEQIYELL